MSLDLVIQRVKYWYLQYLLTTCVYMLEPVERRLFNTFLVTVIAMVIYTTYLFLPGHALMLLHFFRYMLGLDTEVQLPETTVA